MDLKIPLFFKCLLLIMSSLKTVYMSPASCSPFSSFIASVILAARSFVAAPPEFSRTVDSFCPRVAFASHRIIYAWPSGKKWGLLASILDINNNYVSSLTYYSNQICITNSLNFYAEARKASVQEYMQTQTEAVRAPPPCIKVKVF